MLRIQPVGGEPVEVSTAIESNDGENRIAGKVRDALKVDYRIERDDGKDVRINFDRE